MTWPTEKLGSLVTIKTGRLDANAADVDGLYPFFTCSREPLKINSHAFDCDAILIAGNGDLNVKHYNGKFNAYQRTYVVTSLSDKVLDTRYLFYFMDKYVERLRELSIGGVIKYIKLGMLTDAEIPLPPLAEQKRIAAILDKADAIRRKRQQAIKLADEFLRAVFLDMFGDPVTNPKGLKVSTIGDLCDVVTGSTPSRKVESYYGGDIPWVKTTEVDGYIINSTEESISEEGLRNSNCKVNPSGSIVLAMYGQGKTRGKVGILGVPAATNQACAVIKPTSNILMGYMYVYLQLSYESLRALGQGAGQPNLNLSIVKSFPVVLPDHDSQVKFVRLTQFIAGLKEKISNGTAESSSLFRSLSQKSFSGGL